VALSALRGGIGFLSTLPVGAGPADWDAFRSAPWVFPFVGLLIGLGPVVILLLPLPPMLQPVMAVMVLYLLVGITHLDGLADTLDARAAHHLTTATGRREVMHDHSIGVAAVAAVTLSLVGLIGGYAGLRGVAVPAVIGVVLLAEVLAKTMMALLVCLSAPAHAGLGASLLERAGTDDLWWVALAALPGISIGLAAGAGVAAMMLGVALVITWGIRRASLPFIGGVSGDLLGATNEVVRLATLYTGVIAWTLS
jgi:adenosylcobinamide-GDP ribazoletransferase